MEIIFKRRSIRKYTNQEISDDMIEKIIRAGMAAPSSHNEQPWQFIVIRDKNILYEIPKFHPYSKMLYEANTAIAVCGDLSDEKKRTFWVQNCSAATQNILLMSQSLGLGAVWLAIYPREERVKGIQQLLSLPEHIIPLSVVPLGYPAEKKEANNRFDKSKVHFNKW